MWGACSAFRRGQVLYVASPRSVIEGAGMITVFARSATGGRVGVQASLALRGLEGVCLWAFSSYPFGAVVER